jgi:hypothetical protein
LKPHLEVYNPFGNVVVHDVFNFSKWVMNLQLLGEIKMLGLRCMAHFDLESALVQKWSAIH